MTILSWAQRNTVWLVHANELYFCLTQMKLGFEGNRIVINTMPLLKDTQQANPHRSKMNISASVPTRCLLGKRMIQNHGNTCHCIYDVYHHGLFAELCFGLTPRYTGRLPGSELLPHRLLLHCWIC